MKPGEASVGFRVVIMGAVGDDPNQPLAASITGQPSCLVLIIVQTRCMLWCIANQQTSHYQVAVSKYHHPAENYKVTTKRTNVQTLPISSRG